MKKRILAATLAVALAVFLATGAVFASPAEDIYFELDGQFAFASLFLGEQKIAGMGFGGGGAIGYNLGNWLFGVSYDYLTFPKSSDPEALMEKFNHHLIRLDVSHIFPLGTDALDLRVMGSLGVDLIQTEYYWDSSYKKFNAGTIKANGTALVYSLGLFLEFPTVPLVTPYIGVSADSTVDKSGVFLYPSANIGVRTTLGKLAGPSSDEPLTITTTPAEFTPDGDGKNDVATIKVKFKAPKGQKSQSWETVVYDERNRPLKTFQGEGKPGTVKFDGVGDNGQELNSITDYLVKTVVTTDAGEQFEKTATLRTGILVVHDGENLKIKVPEIYFDPDAATFNRISEEQRASNQRVFQFVADALKEYETYSVVVEGHANNVSGTEEEEITELLPLSQLRAETIMNILIENGIDASRLSAVGMGGRKPLGSGAEAWRNRRVEFILKK